MHLEKNTQDEWENYQEAQRRRFVNHTISGQAYHKKIREDFSGSICGITIESSRKLPIQTINVIRHSGQGSMYPDFLGLIKDRRIVCKIGVSSVTCRFSFYKQPVCFTEYRISQANTVNIEKEIVRLTITYRPGMRCQTSNEQDFQDRINMNLDESFQQVTNGKSKAVISLQG